MQPIQGLFHKYTTLTPPESSRKKVVCVVVKRECGITVKEEDVRLGNGGIFLGCHPVERSEILRSTHTILCRLREEYSLYLSFIR